MSDHIPHAVSPAPLRTAGIVVAIAAIVVAAAGIYIRISHAEDLKKAVDAQHVTVKVVEPKPGSTIQKLILPGDVRADVDAPIYARVNGYLKAWYEDIGAHVKKGQLLGEIETPELDQQILRAKADVASAESNWEIADVTSKRYQNLVDKGSVSRQEADEKAATAKARHDLLNAAQANLQSLQAEQSFQRIIAPFDGIVTERNTDIGKLITTGSNNGQPLFRVVDNRRLRIYTEIPQYYAYLIKPKMQVKIYFPEQPSVGYTASVLGISNAIRESSRTSTVQLLMENKEGKVFSGSYAEVHFGLPANSSATVFRLPVSTLLFRKEGLQVATVDANNRVALKHITVVRDLGRVVEVSSGIDASDKVIDSPSDSIVQGDPVVIKNSEVHETTGHEDHGHEQAGSL
jgi:RND family efflux transporter MFP subunit